MARAIPSGAQYKICRRNRWASAESHFVITSRRKMTRNATSRSTEASANPCSTPSAPRAKTAGRTTHANCKIPKVQSHNPASRTRPREMRAGPATTVGNSQATVIATKTPAFADDNTVDCRAINTMTPAANRPTPANERTVLAKSLSAWSVVSVGRRYKILCPRLKDPMVTAAR